MYCIGGFLHISCSKSLRGSTSAIPGLLPSKTCFKFCPETRISAWKIQLMVVFLNPKMLNYLKTHCQKFQLSASVCYLIWRMANFTLNWFTMLPFWTSFLGCFQPQQSKKTWLTLKLSFIGNFLQTILHPKFSLMVQREGKESLWWLSSRNLFMKYTLTGVLLTVLYSSGNYEPFFWLSDMSTTQKLPEIVLFPFIPTSYI